jgi:hypothetical protein
MALSPEFNSDLRVKKAFTRKHERNILLLILERLVRGKGAVVYRPSTIDSHFGNRKCSSFAKGLKPHGRAHRIQGLLKFGRRFAANNSKDSGHKATKGGILKNWSRREELNTPSAKYNLAALTLSYTGNKALTIRHLSKE